MNKKTIFILVLIGIILIALSVLSMILAMTYPLISFAKFMHLATIFIIAALIVLIISLFEYLKGDE